MTSELWVPQGATGHSVAFAGRNTETGENVDVNAYTITDPVTGKQETFVVPTEETMSEAQLEDMVSTSVDNWLRELRQKDHKPAPTPEQRKEIGKTINDIRKAKIKRNSSSNGVIYIDGLGGVYGRKGKRTRFSRGFAGKG